jgi:glycoside/pentoside/hexuronide:cation symporter, GPH family
MAYTFSIKIRLKNRRKMNSNGTPVNQAPAPIPATRISTLTIRTMLFYSLANIGLLAIDSIFDQYVGMLYIDHKFITVPIMLGIACFIGRVVDAAANPVVGYLSDRSFGPRGRRMPFILRGGFPMAVFFVLLFFPFSRNNNFNFVYTMICSSGMLFFFTYVCAPYTALIPELASTNDDRVKLATFQSLAGILGIIIAFVVAGGIIDTFIARFKASGHPGYIPYSYSIMGLSVGILSLIVIYTMAVGIKGKPCLEENSVKLGFWESFLPSLKNPLFIFYAISISSFWIGFKVLQTSINFICKYVFGKSEAYGSVVGFGGMIVVWLAATPFVFFLQKKFGKKALFTSALLFISVVSFAQGCIDFFPKNLGLYFYLGLIFSFGIPFAALLVLYTAIIADIIDDDEKKTGIRRDAMYYGVEGFVSKLARGGGWVIVTALFQIFGTPSPANHRAMIVSGPVCGLFALIGFFAFLKYPIIN